MLILLYYYRHLNDKNFTNLPFTNLITHKVRIKQDIKSTFVKYQKR